MCAKQSNKLNLLTFIMGFLLIGSMAQAQEAVVAGEIDRNQLTFHLDQVSLEKVQVLDQDLDPFSLAPENLQKIEINPLNQFNIYAGGDPNGAAGGDPIAIANGMMVLGQKIWKFVEDNQPVVSAEGAYAHIVPEAVNDWQELENWDRPVSALYRATYKNLYGITVVDLGFRVTFTPRGSYQGHGKYIANLVVLPEIVDVAWGYTVEAGAKVYEVVNRGTTEDPIAAAQVAVSWNVKTILKNSTTNKTLFVEGDGSLTNLSSME